MGEELLPGLVKVVEERMGLVGRPFTTIIVIAAGLGVIAWGAGTVLMVRDATSPIHHKQTEPEFGGDNPLVLYLGGMAEWTMAAVLKTVMQATVSWVRIPLPPPPQ